LLLKELCTEAIKPIGDTTLMNKKNLMSQMVNPVNPITIQDLPSEMVELSEEALSQVFGGCEVVVVGPTPGCGGCEVVVVGPTPPCPPVVPPPTPGCGGVVVGPTPC
jgi:hypothetical protein